MVHVKGMKDGRESILGSGLDETYPHKLTRDTIILGGMRNTNIIVSTHKL